MHASRAWRRWLSSDQGVLVLVALGWLIFLTLISALTTGQYGFHRDELNFVENARHLDWGYVEYPPFTPFIGWVVIQLFGPSLVALRFTTTLAVCVSLYLTGLMARELGGTRPAQVSAALFSVVAPIVLFNTRFFSYQTFDYLWWVLITYFLIRLLKSENPRWWLAIGAAIGLGMMTKYSIPFLVGGLAVGMLLTPARRYLKSPWLWAGAALALLLFLPNLIWQVQHDFVSLEFQRATRAYNIQMGRTTSFILEQFYICTNVVAIVLWTSGLYFYLFRPAGQRYRLLGWLYLVCGALFMAAQGRFYYLAGLYPMLIAAGTSQASAKAALTNKAPSTGPRWAFWRGLVPDALVIGGLIAVAITIPLAPAASGWWNFDAMINPELREEIGWPELVQTVAQIHAALPEEEKARAGILANNYGEAGAINLYGPEYGLPKAISGVNTYWLRGYGDPPPQTLIVLSMRRSDVDNLFITCALAGHTPNPYHIENEETRDHPDIFLCRNPRQPWPAFWKSLRYFG